MLIWQHMDQMKRCEYYLDACCWILNEAALNIEIIFSAAESRSHILNIQNSVENLNLYYYILTFILFIYLYFFTLQLKTRNLILSSYPSCHRPRDRVQFSNLSQTPLSVMLGDINCVSQIFFSYDVVANTVFSIAAYWIESIILSYKKLNMLHNWNVLFCDQINH